MRIGIITLNDVGATPNYGNILQIYALNKYLCSFLGSKNKVCTLKPHCIYSYSYPQKGYKRYITYLRNLDWNIRLCISQYINNKNEIIRQRKRLFNNFLVDNGIYTLNITPYKLKHITFDLIIVGSDIVWQQRNNCVNNYYFLNYKTNINTVRASYAASFGTNHIPIENANLIKNMLNEFEYVSVREKKAMHLLKDLKIDCVTVLDPTFLINKEEWRKLEVKPRINICKCYVFAYILGENECTYKYIYQFAKQRNLMVITIKHPTGWVKYTKKYSDIMQLNQCSPQEFLWLIDNSEYVITDSFHGIAFSLNLNKKFIAIKREGANELNDRITNILELTSSSQLMMSIEDLKENNCIPNYEALDEAKSLSKKYIENLLEFTKERQKR